MKTFPLVIEKAEGGYWGRISDGSDLITSFGNSIEDLKNNMSQALELLYEDKGEALPECEYDLVIDIQEFFTINNYINISTLAEHIGMNASLLRQYAKGIKYPSLKQVRRIESAVKEIGHQLIRTELQPS
jgi:predicted RNase H-like HicB family nuclease